MVSILIPQRGRPAQIKRCLELILQNTSYPNYEVILICDKDDLSSVSSAPKDKRVKIVIIPYKPLPPKKTKPILDGNLPQRPMYVEKINYAYKNIAKGDYIVYLANDVEVGKNWLTEAMKTMKEKPPDGVGGLVSFNDGVYEGEFAPHGLISRKFVEEFLGGYVLHPAYKHYYADSDLGTTAKRFKRFYYADKSVIHHKWASDDIRAPMRRLAPRMKEVYFLRKKRGFPTVKEEIEGCQAPNS